jgi:(E)-4-hydroxy-3-methylbut-2-enyl-diphosphate synthase
MTAAAAFHAPEWDRARVGHLPPRYVMDSYRRRRRPTRVVYVGKVGVGGSHPIRVQSMTTTDTMDTDGTVAQTVRLVQAGCEIVRITAPTVEDARNLGAIRRILRSKGIDVPLVADIHFSPAAALEAAEHVEKVRINPGNFADSKRFAVHEYSDEEYLGELRRIEERFAPLVEKCKAQGVAMRIGTNHGSLSDRIMNRFGDTPLGMVESALEFAHICAKYGYHELIFSMKASNPKVMIQAYRLLAARLAELGLDYPFHLGVTEAGNGEDGRIKSAIGIGSLLEDGIGDTIRVSLTEDPEYEVPVAFALAVPYQTTSPGSRGPRAPGTRDARRQAGGARDTVNRRGTRITAILTPTPGASRRRWPWD